VTRLSSSVSVDIRYVVSEGQGHTLDAVEALNSLTLAQRMQYFDYPLEIVAKSKLADQLLC